MGINKLPTELVSIIAWSVDADDFENFAISSERLYNCFRPRFADHRRWCRTFRTVVVGQRDRRDDRSTSFTDGIFALSDALDAFSYFFDYPARARHIHSLEVNDWSWAPKVRDVNELLRLAKKMETFIANHPGITCSWEYAQLLEDMTTEISKRHSAASGYLEMTEQTAMALIPLLCPNLRRLNRSASISSDGNYLLEQSGNLNATKSWKDIEKVFRGRTNLKTASGRAWPSLKQFLPIPTVTQIHLDQVYPTGTMQDEFDICPNLEGLFISRSNIPLTRLSGLLRSTTRLQQLSYEHDSNGPGLQDPNWSPSSLSLFQEIGAKVGTTLKKLSLVPHLGLLEAQTFGWKYPLGHLSDFRQLASLEELHVPILWLMSPEPSRYGDFDSPASMFPLLRNILGEGPLPCNLLAPRLPQSLKTLALDECRARRELRLRPDPEHDFLLDARWRRMYLSVLGELFGVPVQPIIELLPNLTSIQLKNGPEPFITELWNALKGSDCVVSTNIDI